MRLTLRNLTFVIVLLLMVILAAPTRAGWIDLYSLQADATATLTPQAVQLPPQPENPDQSSKALTPPMLIEADQLAGVIDPDTANLYLAYALANDPRLPAGYQGTQPWDGTLAMMRLKRAVEEMPTGQERLFVQNFLDDACGSKTYSVNTDHFFIQWSSIGGGLTINNYAASLEAAYQKEVTDFGWGAPPVASYHVVVDNLGPYLYGYVTTTSFVGNNPYTAWNDKDAYASCMVLNNNYLYFPGTPQKALDATTAHEFNHSIQFGIGALSGAKLPDDNLIEGGATWMEDEVFDSANDNYNYLWPSFSQCMGQYTASPYPYWITYRGMTERFGSGVAGGAEQVMQDFWELTSKEISGNLTALNTALVNKGTTLADAFHEYAVTVKFNKSCGGGYVYPYCFEEGPNYVANAGTPPLNGGIASVGGSYSGSVRNNYAINWVGLPNSGFYDVVLQNTAAGGALRASVVCDTGSSLNVTPLPAVVGAGQTRTLYGYTPAGCSSVVAVITNQEQTAENPSSCTSHSYLLRAVQAVAPTNTPTPTSTPTNTPHPPLDQFYYFPVIIKD